jgi:hypothetical protein
MVSKLGMMSYSVSDVLTNCVVLISFILKFNNHRLFYHVVPGLIFFTYKVGVAYGLNEAIDFYKYKKEFLHNFGSNCFEKMLGKIYAYINKLSYLSYKNKYPIFNKKMVQNMLRNTKEYGPGNYCIIVVAFVLLLGLSS